jgi:hypothetical protein
MQKVMICTTYRPSLRAEIDGLSFEDGDAVVIAWRERLGKYNGPDDMPVGLVGSGPTRRFYKTILHALGDSWQLLAPPQKEVHDHESDGKPATVSWTWWLVKENVNET